MKTTLLGILFFPVILLAQTAVGPNSAGAGANAGGIGTLPWTNTGNILTSDDSYASVSQSQGTSNYLQGTNFGFALVNTDVIAGITLGVEKSVTANNVQIAGSWTVGTTRPALAAGINRCLIVMIGLENSLSRNVATVTYGGRPMTEITDVGVGTPFYAETSCWYLLESDLLLTSGTAITFTETGSPAVENFEIVSSALYVNVDQTSPFFSAQTNSTTSNAAAYTFTPNWSIGPGSLSVYGLFCGAPFNSTQGPVNSFTINNGYTKQVDYNNFATGFNSSGGVLMVADKSHTNTAAATETATTSTYFNNSSNRRTIVVVNLRRARSFDNSVRILKAGTPTPSDFAQTTTEWSTVDAYSTYGATNNLWGSTWDYTEINAAGFGGAVSARLNNNGAVRVDHMRITVYKTSILPVELVSFTSSSRGKTVALNWVTASERNVDRFVVERSVDGISFEALGVEKSAGNSEQARYYEMTDERPIAGTNYYRLKTVDLDGSFKYSAMIAEVFAHEPEITVYPNPASGWAKVLSDTGIDEVIIVNARGEVLQQLSGNGKDNSEDLDLSAHEDGVYYICISAHGKTTIRELVKVSREAGELH